MPDPTRSASPSETARKSFIYEVSLQQADDHYAPPGTILVFSLIGPDFFISVQEHDETNKEITRKIRATYVLRAGELVPALNVLMESAR